MRVLGVASECAPLIKTGGLADVAGALPHALAQHGVQVTTLIPGYPQVMRQVAGRVARQFDDLFGGPATLIRAQAAGLDLLVLDAPHLFDRPGNPYLGPYGGEWGDNGVRFAALAVAAAQAAPDFDAVHAHDWQAGLVPAYLRFAAGRRVPSLFTVHNLAFQGKFPTSLFPMLGLPPEAMSVQGVEYYGTVGFLKAGLWYADRISTVSPTYAAEISTPALGMGLDGLLRGRGGHVSGILNGLDTADFDPARDKRLAANFDAKDPRLRAANKAALQTRMGLEPNPDKLLFGFVGRLAWQKGVDILLGAVGSMMAEGAQLAILGTGEWGLEEGCRSVAAWFPGRVAAHIGFDEGLARLIYGGCDVILVPSRFEPCGLAQLAALRYGALPLVAHVGGLADSVVDANEMAIAQGVGTGFHFSPVNQEMLQATVLRVARLWRDQATWRALQRNALATDVSWTRSAARYAELYRGMIADAP
ncbi:glycogen synthase GlgA [Falsiroseomonas sp. HW251]|uniref:glycogen synthase GlgA n=1 Tax=Falsiroseomonas sp. HW251 TaxID=3390998 RepID=UPI003D31995B